jgi:hypothetical protein
MGMLHRMLCTAVVGTAAAFWSAPGAALPIATRVQALAGDGIIDGAASSRHYRGRVGQRRHREAYTRRHGNHAGAAIAGAALGIIGGALTAATAPRYGYHNQPAYEAYPVYAPDPDYGYYSAPVYSVNGYGDGYGYGGGYSGRYYGGYGGGGYYSDPRVLSGQPGSLNQP